MHLIRTLLIAIFPAFMQSYLNRIFGLHLIQPVYTLTTATRTKGIILVVFTFAVGYLVGMIFGCLWNKFMKQSKVKIIVAAKKPVAKKRRR